MNTMFGSPKALSARAYITRFPAMIFGIIFAGMILLVGCGSDAATATQSPTSNPAATATPTGSPTATAIPTTVPATPTVAEPRETPAVSIPEQQPLTDDLLAEFSTYIEETRESYNVPGLPLPW